MKHYQPVLFINGLLLMALAICMFIPSAIELYAGSAERWVFPSCAGVTLFAGGAIFILNFSTEFKLSKSQAFLMTTMAWTVLPLFGSLPFVFGDTHLSFTDAYFEAISGITTTGSTVIVGLDDLPPGILIWRAIMQWIGGLGIIVMSISILPFLRVGGMQLFMVEAFETGDKLLPRAAQISAGITAIFIGLTAILAGVLWLAGMSGFEAAVHAMTTIATGGYSTSDSSVGHFDSPMIEAIITIGMIVGGTPFLLIFMCFKGRFNALLQDTQVHWYLVILALSIATVSSWLWIADNMSLSQALRYSSFTVASIMTGTGYASTDYNSWEQFPTLFIFLLTFVGGCAGSTACGIKVFRLQILVATCRMEFRKIYQPHGVFIPYYNGRPISSEVTNSIFSFFFILIFCFGILTLGLSLLGLDFITAISSAATAISNVGPGFGPLVGPAGTFKELPDAAKWLLAFGMLAGRLEMFTLVVLFSRQIWTS